MRHRLRPLAATLALGTAVTLAACSDELCREPGPDCPCAEAEAGSGDVVVALVGGGSPAVVAGVERLAHLTDAGSELVGVDGDPTVILATYDDVGGVTEVGAFDLDGDGSSELRREASGDLAAACLADAAEALPADEEAGNLIRALVPAAELAAARGSGGAAVVAFGLGRSALDDPTSPTELPMVDIDLRTDAAQGHLVDVLTHVGQVPLRDDVTVVLVDPDEGVANSVVAGDINRFAEGPLCAAINPSRCAVVEVLP